MALISYASSQSASMIPMGLREFQLQSGVHRGVLVQVQFTGDTSGGDLEMHLWKIGLQEDESPGKATYSIAPIHSWKVELNSVLEVVLVQPSMYATLYAPCGGFFCQIRVRKHLVLVWG